MMEPIKETERQMPKTNEHDSPEDAFRRHLCSAIMRDIMEYNSNPWLKFVRWSAGRNQADVVEFDNPYPCK